MQFKRLDDDNVRFLAETIAGGQRGLRARVVGRDIETAKAILTEWGARMRRATTTRTTSATSRPATGRNDSCR